LSVKKSQNSVLVLATLGVYLGLVFAGAAPQVLASAAMARTFDIQDEIERQDDLDNKPDEKRSPVTASVQIYLEDVELFLSRLGRLANGGKFDFSRDRFDVAQTTMLPCVESSLAGRFTPIRFETTSYDTRSALESLSRGMVYGYSLGDCVASTEFGDSTAVDSKFNFGFDGKVFQINVAVKKHSTQNALELQHALESTLRLYAAKAETDVRKKIIEHTSFKIKNDQVFVVTRLPRAGLTSLLAIAK
jgi:hypothetical protein